MSENESTDIIVREETPTAIVERQKEIANAVREIVQRNHVIEMGGKKYVEVAGLTMLATASGLTVASGEPQRINIDGVGAWKVQATVLNRDGKIISSGWGIVADDEPTWNKRPLFARASMASTRAAGRALRMLFSPLVVSMGYEATPAEEMPRDDRHEEPKRVANTAEKPPTAAKDEPPRAFTDAELRHTKNVTSDAVWDVGTVIAAKITSGERNGKPWTRYAITLEATDGEVTCSTFDKDLGTTLARWRAKGEKCSFATVKRGKYFDIVGVEPIDDRPPAPEPAKVAAPSADDDLPF